MSLLALSFSGEAQTWNQVTVPTQENLNDIQFVDNQIGYIAGNNLTLLKTTDGGTTWTALAPMGLPFQGNGDIQEIEFVNANVGYLTINNQSGVYKTTDGGLNWAMVQNNQTNQCFPVCIYANAEDDMFVGGSDCFQGGTINEYQTPNWTNQSISGVFWDTQEFVADLDFEGNLGLAAVNNEYIYRSTDAGATWDTINSNIGNGNVLTSILIANNDTCYAGYNQNGGGFGILYSTDAGLTWQEDINSATFFYPAYYGATMNNAGTVYMAAVPSFSTDGLIFQRSGNSWIFETVTHPVYAMDSYGNDITWAVGDNGYVVVNADLSLSVDPITPENGFVHLYPNPANDHLNWECDGCNQAEVRIFDVKGNEVMQILDVPTNTLNVSELNTGVYVFQLNSEEGTFRQRFVHE